MNRKLRELVAAWEEVHHMYMYMYMYVLNIYIYIGPTEDEPQAA